MEPQLRTARDLKEVEAELRELEPIFHTAAFEMTRADLEAKTAVDFWEVTASGRRYSRDEIIDLVAARGRVPGDDAWETSEFHCRQLGADTYALTYALRQGQRLTRRLTVWERTASGWKVAYHQGTVVDQSASDSGT